MKINIVKKLLLYFLNLLYIRKNKLENEIDVTIWLETKYRDWKKVNIYIVHAVKAEWC